MAEPRRCESCGGSMPTRTHRSRDKEGRLVCDSCKALTGWRMHSSLTTSDVDEYQRREAEAIASITRVKQKTAHDSGDNAIINHCFAGETKYWTRDGLKTLAETVGTTQWVLSSPHRGGAARWVAAEIHDFGILPLMKVTLRRNKRTKVIHATADHRWWVRPQDTKGANNNQRRVVVTRDLQPEHRLAWALPKSRLASVTPSPFGVAHGLVYGDGTKVAHGSRITLWGEKDEQMLRYFSVSRTSPSKTPNGVLGTTVHVLPSYFKDRPALSVSASYLYGWLAGYFAADGTVSKQGQVILHSASRESMEFVQHLAMLLGVGAYDIVEKQRQGYGDEPTMLFQMQFIGSTLTPEFFLTKEHRTRYEAVSARGGAERVGWTVVSVEETDRVEPVYCAVVPGDENFVLDGLINTMNCPFCGSGAVVGGSDGSVSCDYCHSVFTVQVQPAHPNMPQTINGQPMPPPGMPAGQETEMSTPVDPAVDENSSGDIADPLGQAEPDAAEQAGQHDPTADQGADKGDSEGDGKKKDLPPWMKKKTSLDPEQRFFTTEGEVLDTNRYLARLALDFADDRLGVLASVRDHNEG